MVVGQLMVAWVGGLGPGGFGILGVLLSNDPFQPLAELGEATWQNKFLLK